MLIFTNVPSGYNEIMVLQNKVMNQLKQAKQDFNFHNDHNILVNVTKEQNNNALNISKFFRLPCETYLLIKFSDFKINSVNKELKSNIKNL